MFSLFKSDPTKKLKSRRDAILEKAMNAQRNGDIRTYSELTVEADELYHKIQELENKPS